MPTMTHKSKELILLIHCWLGGGPMSGLGPLGRCLLCLWGESGTGYMNISQWLHIYPQYTHNGPNGSPKNAHLVPRQSALLIINSKAVPSDWRWELWAVPMPSLLLHANALGSSQRPAVGLWAVPRASLLLQMLLAVPGCRCGALQGPVFFLSF